MTLKADILAAFPNLPAGRDDGLIASTLSNGRTKLAPVQAAAVRGALYAMGVWPSVVQRANAARANVDSTPVATVCQTLYDLSSSDQAIPMDQSAVNARVTSDLNLMVTAGLMTSQQEAYVLSLATVPDVITPQMVSVALEGI